MRIADYTPARLYALMAFLRAGLCVLFAFAALIDRRMLRGSIEQAVRWTETFIFIAAFNRAAPIRKKAARRPSVAPPGFRRVLLAPQAMLRFARLRGGSLPQRLARLIAVLADPESVIAHVAKRLARPARLIAFAPAALELAPACANGPAAFADTS